MKIGVVSDTHRNKEYLERVVDWLISEQYISTLYHLGDDYEDVAGIADRGIEIVQVPGIYHQKYRNGTLKPKQIENILGLRIILVHSFEKDVTAEDITISDIILYGHTHRPEIKLKDGLLLMNPGHLKAEIDKHIQPSFGLLDIQDRKVSAKLFDMDFEEMNSVDLMRSESGLYRT